jgi:hypothetical protein
MNPMGELGTAVAIGAIPGWESFRKFGMNPNVIVSSTQEMWPLGTRRVLPTTPAVVSTVSDDAADTNLTGTGGWELVISGLGPTFLEQEETIELDGLNPVTTTALFSRINRTYCKTAGTSGINVGNISSSIGGNIQAYIESDQGQTHQALYTVPANKYLLITGGLLGVGRMGGSTDLRIMSQIKLNGVDGPDASWRSISDIYLWNGQQFSNLDTDVIAPPLSEIRQVIVSDTTTQAHGIFQGYLIDDNVGI